MCIAIPTYFLDSERTFESLNFDFYPWRYVISESVELRYGRSSYTISKFEASQYAFRTQVDCAYGEGIYGLRLVFNRFYIILLLGLPPKISVEISLDDFEKASETEKRLVIASIENDPTFFLLF